MIKVDLTYAKLASKDMECKKLAGKIADAHKKLLDPNGQDNRWLDLPISMVDKIETINTAAKWVRENCDVLLVIGTGGSYSGTYAGIEMLRRHQDFPVEFLGSGLDPEPIEHFVKKYKDARIAINIVSKSGTTLEVTTAFDIIGKLVTPQVIFVTTGSKDFMPDCPNRFDIPNGVGGRFSVLSAVGLFPFAVAGIDIAQVLDGARQVPPDQVQLYAMARYLLHTRNKKDIEVLTSFHHCMGGLGNWWQQLFGESEGKQGSGLFPVPMTFSRDLHSMGQYIQQGKPLLFETVIKAGELNRLNNAAYLGTIKAHSDAGVPLVLLTAPDTTPRTFGTLIQFFHYSVAMSAYLLGVNPFDQPGVEFYKKNMRDIINSSNYS